jgi:sugar-specific transcriptional regulator TrmB/DNA-binding CsgD family transcriptional regulator
VSTNELLSHLTSLGLDDNAALVYGKLLSREPSTIDEIADDSELSVEEARASAAQLIEAGLVGRTADGAELLVPLPPDAALKVLSARREAELHQATLATQAAYRSYNRSTQPPPTSNVVEVVTGPAIMERIDQAIGAVQREIRQLDSPPHYAQAVENERELIDLARGIRYRAVYSQASVALDGYYERNILPCIEAGEQARVMADVPVKLSIIDDTMALVGLPIGEADVNQSLLIVRPSSLFSALTGLFDLCWRSALPMRIGGGAAARLEPVEQRLLTLLAVGLTDEVITRKLGVSRRTFFRYLERLQTQAGASTRFQLGMHAVRERWLDGRP